MSVSAMGVNNRKVLFGVFVLLAFLIAGISLLFYTASRAPWSHSSTGPNVASSAKRRAKKPSVFQLAQGVIQSHLPTTWTIQVMGTTGTPVVVGYRPDGWHSGVFKGVVPTNFTVLARGRVNIAIKNVGTNGAQLEASASPGTGRWWPGWSSSVIYPPFYGACGESKSDSSSFGGDIGPLDWPVTLPPGMTKREAMKIEVYRGIRQGRLKYFQDYWAKDPQNSGVLATIGRLQFELGDRPAAESSFEKVFKADCSDAAFLNFQTYFYAEHGGTNLDLACQAALKARALAPQDPYIADTVGWILFKEGDYRQALPLLEEGRKATGGTSSPSFHVGLAYYMLQQEDAARNDLRSVTWGAASELQEAKNCLAMLDFQPGAATADANQLKARLEQNPDDPVALDRLGQLFERAAETNRLRQDALGLKAAGVKACRREDWAVAARYLSQSAQKRETDAQLFFYLGIALWHLGQQSECDDALRKALALNLKLALAREAQKVLAGGTPAAL